MKDKKKQEITIAWDVDDVLNSLTTEWFAQYKKEHNISLAFTDLTSNPPHNLLGIRKQEYLDSLDKFRAQHLMDLPPNSEMLFWFEAHGHEFRHIALTATPFRFANLSANWVVSHFGRWIRSFNFVPSPRAGSSYPAYDENKGEFLNWLGNVDIFIDDNEENIRNAESFGIKTFLFPAPWNQAGKNNEKDFVQSTLINKICGEKND